MVPGRSSNSKSHLAQTARKSKAKAPNVGEDSAVSVPTQSCLVVNWNKDRTTRLLNWLDQNPVDCHCLFSDLIAHAKAEGQKKVKAKGDKVVFYKKITEAVFNIPEETPDLCEQYQRQPDKFVSSVTNYLSW